MTQYASPDSDVSNVNWTDDAGGGSPIFDSIDDTQPTANDGDYIKSPVSPTSSDVVRFTLSNVIDPVSSTGHIIRFRHAKSAAAGKTIDITVNLLQGGVQKATTTVTSSGTTFTEWSYTLTGTEADSISNYNDLDFQVYAVQSGTGGNRDGRVSYLVFEVPDAPSGTIYSSSISIMW